MRKDRIVQLLLASATLSGCMVPDDQTNEKEEFDVSHMMDTGTLVIDTSEELFTVTGTRRKRSLDVKINPIGSFRYIIQQAEMTIKVKDYPVKKKSNESFQVELPKDSEGEELEIRIFISANQPIWLNKKRYDDSTALILLRKYPVDWKISE